MKKNLAKLSVLSAILSLILNISCNKTINDKTNVIEAIKACSDSLVKAEGALDVESALQYYAEDAIIQPDGSPQIQGKESIAKMYQQFFEFDQLKEFYAKGLDVIVSQSGDLAYEIGINRTILSNTQGDLVSNGKYLIVWKKVEDKWLVAALTFSDNTAEPYSFNQE